MLIALFPSGAGGISTIDENTETTFTGLLKGNGATIEQAVADEDYATKQYVDEHAGGDFLSIASPINPHTNFNWSKYNKDLVYSTGEDERDPSITFSGSTIISHYSTKDAKYSNDSITFIEAYETEYKMSVDTIGRRFNFDVNSENVKLGGVAKPVQDTDVANKKYVDEHAAAMAIQTLTLSQSSWQEKSQTVDCPGILEDETKQLVYVSAKTTDLASYNNSGVSISAVSADQLTFTCDTKPEADLTVYVAIQAAKGAAA